MKYFVIACSIFLLSSCGQTVYQVGTSVVSLEPTDETVSLALAGYAVPYRGRFSITWEDKGLFEDITDMADVAGKLYLLDKNGKLSVWDRTGAVATTTGTVRPPATLTGFGDALYALSGWGDLLVCRPPGNMNRQKTGGIKNVTALTASDKHLYAATSEGKLLEGTVSGEGVTWQVVGEATNTAGLACDRRNLYAVTKDNYLLQCSLKRPGNAWQRIGYNNETSYTIDIKKIVFSGHKLYALAADHHLYMSKHNTEGKMSARAMAIRKGKNTAIIVGADVCGLDYSFTNEIKKEIFRRRGIPAEAIMINSSHTHFTPVTQAWRTWGKQNQYPDSLYLNGVVRPGIIRAIEEAVDGMAPAYLSFGRDTTDIGSNRRQQPVYDNDVDVLQAVSVDGNTKTLLFLTGCHPVFTDPEAGNYTINTNFPGHAREILQQAGFAGSIFLQGCAGDINPKTHNYPFKTSGKMLAADVLRALQGKMFPVNGNIRFQTDSIGIPVHPWTHDQIQTFRNEHAEKMKPDIPGGAENDVAGRNVRWADMMLDYIKTGSMPATMPIYVQIFDIGDWKLVGLSREVTTRFGIAIKELFPGQKVSVAAYSNDVASYLATDPHIEAEDYEGYDSFFWYGQPSPFPLGVFDTVIAHIKNTQ
ncbi:MAG: hypothetical protein LBS03_07005 [Bacteroidales bacterium]|jgi:hypothetical protein|nr:hypothetical protein [Bacteroidales bacterium]